MDSSAPLVGVVMGSRSDWETMAHATEILRLLGIPYETRVVSAHRTPDLLAEYAKSARGRGLRMIIAGAGGAAHLPGMLAAFGPVPAEQYLAIAAIGASPSISSAASAHSAASTFRGGVCTTGASSGAPNDWPRRSLPTGR